MVIEPARILGPGTADDLIADARLHRLNVTHRTILDWQAKGLLDKPEGQPGRGRGQGRGKSIYSKNQRELFRSLVQKRKYAVPVPALASIPVWLWLYWGDEYVPLRQVRLALRTHWRSVQSPTKTRAQQWAEKSVELYAHPEASETTRKRFVRLATQSMTSTGPIDPDVRQAMAEMVDPRAEDLLIGPPGAALSATTIIDNALARERGITLLLDVADPIDDERFGAARALSRKSFGEYLQERPELAAHAGQLSWLFRQATLASWVQDSPGNLTGTITIVCNLPAEEE